MNKKIREIINYYGINNQLKYFQSEVFELNESILNKINSNGFDEMIDCVTKICSTIALKPYKNIKIEHIKEEIADVFIMLREFQLYYGISSEEINTIMKFKVDRQLNRIKNESDEAICQKN